MYQMNFCPVGWGCRIHQLHLCRAVISPPPPPPLTSVLDMTLSNLIVWFQQCWGFGECKVLLHCHRSQLHSGWPGVAVTDRGLSIDEIEIKCLLMLNCLK